MFKKLGQASANDQLAHRIQKIAVAQVIDADLPVERSDLRDPRQPTFKPATIRLAGGERMDVVVKDASASGVKIVFLRRVRLTDQIMISEPTLRISTWAQVVWQTVGAAGLRFLDH
jgi:hypothetical protein